MLGTIVAERMQEKDEYNGFPLSKENEHSRLHRYTYAYTYTCMCTRSHIHACTYKPHKRLLLLSLCMLATKVTRALSEEHYHLYTAKFRGRVLR